jgi:hypothetical protein
MAAHKSSEQLASSIPLKKSTHLGLEILNSVPDNMNDSHAYAPFLSCQTSPTFLRHDRFELVLISAF